MPGNVAVAAHPDVEYVTVERSMNGTKEKLILAKALMEKVFRGEEVKVVDTFKGKKLKGQKYHPLFTFLPPDKPAHYVVLGDFVTTEDGTGLVHMAPAFGAEDMQAALEFDLPVLMTVLPDGTFIPEVTPWRGVFVKDADPLIILDLDRAWPPVPHGKDHTHLSLLLAMQDPAPLLRARGLVHPHQPVQGTTGGIKPYHPLDARPHPGRPLRQLARK